jgi:hypothetical protein
MKNENTPTNDETIVNPEESTTIDNPLEPTPGETDEAITAPPADTPIVEGPEMPAKPDDKPVAKINTKKFQSAPVLRWKRRVEFVEPILTTTSRATIDPVTKQATGHRNEVAVVLTGFNFLIVDSRSTNVDVSLEERHDQARIEWIGNEAAKNPDFKTDQPIGKDNNPFLKVDGLYTFVGDEIIPSMANLLFTQQGDARFPRWKNMRGLTLQQRNNPFSVDDSKHPELDETIVALRHLWDITPQALSEELGWTEEQAQELINDALGFKSEIPTNDPSQPAGQSKVVGEKPVEYIRLGGEEQEVQPSEDVRSQLAGLGLG